MGADFVARSGLGDELNYVPVDKETLLSTAHDNIFAIGDASNIPASKAGSVAHFSMDVFPDNFVEHVNGQPMTGTFDGHTNCFIETGHGKGLLIDFNYDTEPLPGKYPVPWRRSVQPAGRVHARTTSASSASAGCTGTCCSPAVRLPSRPRCPCTASTLLDKE